MSKYDYAITYSLSKIADIISTDKKCGEKYLKILRNTEGYVYYNGKVGHPTHYKIYGEEEIVGYWAEEEENHDYGISTLTFFVRGFKKGEGKKLANQIIGLMAIDVGVSPLTIFADELHKKMNF